MPDDYVSSGAAWFVLSLVNAGLAQGKGRSGLNWWLISLFVGPLATLLIVVWPAVVPGVPDTPPGTMTRNQALIIGAAVIAIVLLIYGAVVFAG